MCSEADERLAAHDILRPNWLPNVSVGLLAMYFVELRALVTSHMCISSITSVQLLLVRNRHVQYIRKAWFRSRLCPLTGGCAQPSASLQCHARLRGPVQYAGAEVQWDDSAIPEALGTAFHSLQGKVYAL